MSEKRIQIDLWGGELHQKLVRTVLSDSWSHANAVIQEAVEAGLLANVLHLDFKAPAHRQGDVEAAMRALLSEART